MDELLKIVEKLTQRVNKSEERLRQAEEKLNTLTKYIHSKFKCKKKSNIEPTPTPTTPEPEPTIRRELSDPKLKSHSIVRLKRMGVVCSLPAPDSDKDLENIKTVAAVRVESSQVTQLKSEIPASLDDENLNQLRAVLIQNNLPFSCSICANSFNSKILLSQHNQISHSQCNVQLKKLSQFLKTVTTHNNRTENSNVALILSNNDQNFNTEIETSITTTPNISISTHIIKLSDTEDNIDDYNECHDMEECDEIFSNAKNISTEKTQVEKPVKKPAKNSKKRKNSDLVVGANIETLILKRSDRKRKKLIELSISDNEAEDLVINSDAEYNPQEDSQDISMQNEAEENNVPNFPRQKSRKTFKQKLPSQVKAKEFCKNCSLKLNSKTQLMKHRLQYHFNLLSQDDLSEFNKITCIESVENSTESGEISSNTKKDGKIKKRYDDKTPYSSFMFKSCSFCDENFTNASLLLSHLISAHGTNEKLASKMAGFGKFHCDKCKFKILGYSNLVFHSISSHLYELSEEEVKNLNKAADVENMKKLIDATKVLNASANKKTNADSEAKSYTVPPKCMDCDLIFSHPDNFLSHLMSTHELTEEEAKKNEGFSKISCNYCTCESIGTWHSLSHQIKYHLYEMNEEEKNFLLKYTGKEIKELEVEHSITSIEYEKYFFDQEENGENGVKILRTYFNNKFKCPSCHRLFIKVKLLFLHQKNFHNKNSISDEELKSQIGYGTFSCTFPNCSQVIKYGKWKLRAHMLSSHFREMSESERDENLAQIHIISTNYIDAKDDELLKCPIVECSTEFQSKRIFFTHLTTVHHYSVKDAQETAQVYSRINCNYCSEYYANNYKYVNHLLKSHHGTQLNEIDQKKVDDVRKNTTFYRCDPCELFYDTNVEMYLDHLRVVHPERYKSEYLDNPNRSQMRNIDKPKHPSVLKQVSCETCGKTMSKRYLTYHKKTHLALNNLKDKKCSFPNCTFATSTFRALRNHLTSHSEERNFKCNQCPYASKTSDYLRRHMKIKHNSDPPLCCELCGDKFRTKNNLTLHIRGVHQNLRPYACTLCPQKFKATHHLKNHLKSHENTRKRPSWPKGEQKERILCPRRQGCNKIQSSTQINEENNGVVDNVDIHKTNGVVENVDINKSNEVVDNVEIDNKNGVVENVDINNTNGVVDIDIDKIFTLL